MKTMKTNHLIGMGVALSLALSASQARAVTVTVDDLAEGINVAGTGFDLGFVSGTIDNNPEAVWWVGFTSANLGSDQNVGVWLEPGSAEISDKWGVWTAPVILSGRRTISTVAAGVFISDGGTGLPGDGFTIPGTVWKITDDMFSGLDGVAETGAFQDLLNNGRVQVQARSDVEVPDSGSTLALLGLAMMGIAGLRRFGLRAA